LNSDLFHRWFCWTLTLEAIYPIIYLDCIVVKVRQDGGVINKAVFLALAINCEGHKELLGSKR
jgi:putative transposase